MHHTMLSCMHKRFLTRPPVPPAKQYHSTIYCMNERVCLGVLQVHRPQTATPRQQNQLIKSSLIGALSSM